MYDASAGESMSFQIEALQNCQETGVDPHDLEKHNCVMLRFGPITFSLLLSVATVLGFWLPAYSQETGSLMLTQTIPLPDIPGGFNHMSADGKRRRLFVTATTKGTLEIIDLRSGKPWRNLAGERPAAVLFAPEFDQLYVTRGQKLCIYDGSSFDLLTSVDLQSGLDELPP